MTQNKYIEFVFDVQQYGDTFAAYLRPHYLDGDPVEWVPIGRGVTPLAAISDLCEHLTIEKHPMSQRHIDNRLREERKE